MFEHIVRGDTSDGIPNCLSKDSTFVSGDRQTPITKKRVAEWMQKGKVDYKNGDVGFDRNQRLIDFEYIPEDLVDDIVRVFDEALEIPRQFVFPYFVDKRLSSLMEYITEF